MPVLARIEDPPSTQFVIFDPCEHRRTLSSLHFVCSDSAGYSREPADRCRRQNLGREEHPVQVLLLDVFPSPQSPG